MRIIYTYFLILFGSSLLFENCNGQVNPREKSSNMNVSKSVGIPISQTKFDSLIDISIKLLETSSNNITREEFLIMIRLFNTIDVFNLTGNRYKKFRNLFFPNYVDRASKSINAKLWKGMSYYSKEYDIYIGGRPHSNSQYIIHSD